MIPMSYFKNVLNYNRESTTVLILDDDISDDDYLVMKSQRSVKFIWMATQPCKIESGNILMARKNLSPRDLKNINYCLYSGDDIETKQAVLFSGITLVHSLKDIDFDVRQTTLDRVENFELGKTIA